MNLGRFNDLPIPGCYGASKTEFHSCAIIHLSRQIQELVMPNSYTIAEEIALYHSIPHERAKNVLQRLDHAAIFLLIAGTYTPFTLVSLRGSWGWGLFGLVWSIAIAGIVLELFVKKRMKRLSVTLYLGLGWIVVFAIKPMIASIETGGLLLLLAGGLCYSFGVIFYAWKKLAFNHAIWHLFVLAGSILHFFSVLFYVVPAGT
jgi:hemolysin III